MKEKLLEALKSLDTSNDNHWTADGSPRIDTVRMLVSDQNVSRADIEGVAPGFVRSNAKEWKPGEQTAQNGTQAAAPWGAGAGTDSAQNAAHTPAAPAATGDKKTEVANPKQEPVKQVSDAVEASVKEDELKKALADAEKQIAEQELEVDEQKQKLAKMRSARDAMRDELSRMQPSEPEQQALLRRAYLDSQARVLQQRGEQMKLLRESGLNLKQLAQDLRDPIDASRKKR